MSRAEESSTGRVLNPAGGLAWLDVPLFVPAQSADLAPRAELCLPGLSGDAVMELIRACLIAFLGARCSGQAERDVAWLLDARVAGWLCSISASMRGAIALIAAAP